MLKLYCSEVCSTGAKAPSYNSRQMDYYTKWLQWADWDDCGGTWCTHPDCTYHRKEEENFDSENFFKSFPRFREPTADEKDAAMIESLEDIVF